MNEIDKRLERIEEKLDTVLQTHSNRLTQIETQNGFFKIAFAALFSAAAWILNKLHIGQ